MRAKLLTVKPRLFVSYSSKDQQFVDKLIARLKDLGERAWLNTESIPKGNHWYDEMVKGLAETDVLLLVVSANSMSRSG